MSALASLRKSWQEAVAPLQQRWALLQEREQRALGILLVAVLAFVLWGLWLASHRAAQKAEQQYANSRALLQELQRAVPVGAVGGGSVLRAASDAAAGSGLALSRIEPQGDGGVRVWLEKADFNAVARWLALLSGQGVRVEQAQVEKQAEGGVSAQFTLVR